MKLNLVAFGIAKDIIGEKNLVVDYDVMSIAQLKEQLCKDFPEFEALNSISFAINEEYRLDDFALTANDEVVIIPPVAGG